jgi:hypothetical protein
MPSSPSMTAAPQDGASLYDGAKIDVVGERHPGGEKTYRLHPGTERNLRWLGPLREG